MPRLLVDVLLPAPLLLLLLNSNPELGDDGGINPLLLSLLMLEVSSRWVVDVRPKAASAAADHAARCAVVLPKVQPQKRR